MNKHLATFFPSYEEMEDQIKINFDLPHTWSDLNEEQLHYILQLRSASTMSPLEIRVAALCRFTGMEERKPFTAAEKELALKDGIHFMRTKFGSKSREIPLPTWFLSQAQDKLTWLDHPTRDVTRLEKILSHHEPAEANLSDVKFGDYLTIENLWQSAMAWASSINVEGTTPASDQTVKVERETTKLFDQIARILYRPTGIKMLFHRKPFAMSALMSANIVHWLTGWHLFAREQWPHLFKSSGGESSTNTVTPELLREQVDVQISALTGGDVTKLEKVLNVSVWDALNMLDIKSREAEQMRKRNEELKSKSKR